MNPKWTIAFQSLKKVNCQINIYDMTDDSPTDPPVQLTGSEFPVTWDETNDEDLLNVFRKSTGYINIIETDDTSAAIEAMKPSTDIDRKVKVFYGQQLIFVGFMQAQTFKNQWCSNPREMSFPIFSPLSVADNISLPTYNPPQRVKLCELLADVIDILNGIGAEYDTVVWPRESVTLDETISSLTFCPFNDDHTPGVDFYFAPLFAPESLQWALEAICCAFGWMVHEAAHTLVFSKFDQEGDYCKCSASNIRTLTNVSYTFTGSQTYPIENYLQAADNDGSISIIQPYNQIELEYEGGYVKASEINYDHMSYVMYNHYLNQYVAWLQSQTPEITGNYLLVNNSWDTDGKFTSQGVTICEFGSKNSTEKGILVNLPNSATQNYDLFTIKFYDRPTSDAIDLRLGMKWGNNITDLGSDQTVNHKMLGVYIKVGQLYYQGQGNWGSTRPGPVSLGSEFLHNIENTPAGMPIEITFTEIAQSVVPGGRVPLIALTNIRLEEISSVFSEYRLPFRSTKIPTVLSGYGNNIANINMKLNCYQPGSNMIGTTYVSQRSNWFTLYDYMLTSREQLTIKCRITNLLSIEWVYCYYSLFAGKNWRLIGLSYNPWDDEVTIQLQRVISS